MLCSQQVLNFLEMGIYSFDGFESTYLGFEKINKELATIFLIAIKLLNENH